MSEYVRAEALVDAGWVVQHLDDPNVRLVEVDEDTTAMSGATSAIQWAGIGSSICRMPCDGTSSTKRH
jgi:hypothetical protein